MQSDRNQIKQYILELMTLPEKPSVNKISLSLHAGYLVFAFILFFMGLSIGQQDTRDWGLLDNEPDFLINETEPVYYLNGHAIPVKPVLHIPPLPDIEVIYVKT